MTLSCVTLSRVLFTCVPFVYHSLCAENGKADGHAHSRSATRIRSGNLMVVARATCQTDPLVKLLQDPAETAGAPGLAQKRRLSCLADQIDDALLSEPLSVRIRAAHRARPRAEVGAEGGGTGTSECARAATCEVGAALGALPVICECYCHAMVCDATLCYVMLRYVMLCKIILRFLR